MQKGFSLIELIIYIGVFGGLTVVIMNLFVGFTQQQVTAEARSEVQQNLRFATETMTQAIRGATGLNEPASAGATSSTLSLAMADAGVDPTVFDVSAGVLRLTEGVSPAENLTSGRVQVDSITFTRVENPSAHGGAASVAVQIDITISASSSNPREQYSQRSIVSATLPR